MSVVMIEALKFALVSPTQKLVLFALADCHNERTLRCDPSYADLMKVTGLSNRAIANALKALREAGYVQFIGGQKGIRSAYVLTPQTSEPDDTKPVSEVHRLAARSSEPESQVAVNVVPEPVNLVPKAVNEGHINRKEPEGTGNKPEPKGGRSGWRERVRAEADESSAVPLPQEWSEPLRAAVSQFFEHRHEMATKPTVKTDVKPWTVRAATNTVSQVTGAMHEHGEAAVLGRIRSALSGSWQGLNLDKLTSSHRYQPTLKLNGSDDWETASAEFHAKKPPAP